MITEYIDETGEVLFREARGYGPLWNVVSVDVPPLIASKGDSAVKPAEERYIVLCGQIIGNAERSNMEYSWDHRYFRHHNNAVQNGFTKGRSDDFNIGKLVNGRLKALMWMTDVIDENASVLLEIEKQIGLQPNE